MGADGVAAAATYCSNVGKAERTVERSVSLWIQEAADGAQRLLQGIRQPQKGCRSGNAPRQLRTLRLHVMDDSASHS